MTTRILTVAALLLLPFAASAQTETPAAPAVPEVKAFGGRITGEEHLTAVIDAIKPETREVTLRASDGEVISFVVGPDVRNFAQMKVGDKLDLLTAVELTVVVTNAPREPERTDSIEVARAAEGDKPGLVIVMRSKGSAVIDAIDYTKRTATLRGPKRTVEIEASAEAKNFNEAKVGDTVLVDYIETVLISVSAPAP